MITRIGSVTLDVPDLRASCAFFTEKVGLKVTEADAGTAYLTSTHRHHELVLVAARTAEPALRHLNFEVAPGTLAECVDRAISTGAGDLGAIAHAGIGAGRLLSIPHGFTVKLFSELTDVTPPPPRDLPLPTQFSHFNIAVPQVAEMMDFMAHAFGLRPSDWLRSKENPLCGWMHAPVDGAPHHGVAILESEGPKLHHIAFDYEQVADVAARVDNYVDETHYLVWGMGRHGTGGSVFAYIEDVSGMMVELGSGMITIGNDPRWREPRVWPLDDPRGVDEWGSQLPAAWLAKRVRVLPATQVAMA